MPRIARIVVAGYPYHITQRGNCKQAVFNENTDYEVYYRLIAKYSTKYALSILAYCFMPNHIHIVATPREQHSMAKTFHVCNMRYAQYFNKKYGLSGHLWQGRFFSCLLGENHFHAAIRYVENNPVRSKLVTNAENWPWSSASAHCSKNTSILSLNEIFEPLYVADWREYLNKAEDQNSSELIREHTTTGRPLGDDIFIQQLETFCKKRLHALPRGRPNK